MAEHGVDYSQDLFMKGFGRNNFEILAEQMPTFSSAKISQVSEEKELAYRNLLIPGSLGLLPGVEHWLSRFAELGLRQVIGSSAPMANIIAMVHVLGIGDYFHAIVSGYKLPRGKPDPMIFLCCAAAAETAPDACLVVEDSIHGVEAAWRAGIPNIAVGSIADSEAIEFYKQASWPPCLPVKSLEDVRWEELITWHAQQ